MYAYNRLPVFIEHLNVVLINHLGVIFPIRYRQIIHMSFWVHMQTLIRPHDSHEWMNQQSIQKKFIDKFSSGYSAPIITQKNKNKNKTEYPYLYSLLYFCNDNVRLIHHRICCYLISGLAELEWARWRTHSNKLQKKVAPRFHDLRHLANKCEMSNVNVFGFNISFRGRDWTEINFAICNAHMAAHASKCHRSSVARQVTLLSFV